MDAPARERRAGHLLLRSTLRQRTLERHRAPLSLDPQHPATSRNIPPWLPSAPSATRRCTSVSRGRFVHFEHTLVTVGTTLFLCNGLQCVFTRTAANAHSLKSVFILLRTVLKMRLFSNGLLNVARSLCCCRRLRCSHSINLIEWETRKAFVMLPNLVPSVRQF